MAIEITEGTTELIISILRDHIFVHTGDTHSDKTTHPIEVNLLDQLIEKLNDHRHPPSTKENTDECICPWVATGKRSHDYVLCSSCQAQHHGDDDPSRTEFLDIREDPLGQDVMKFKCLNCGNISESFVLRKATPPAKTRFLPEIE